jgi:hypothetical protein
MKLRVHEVLGYHNTTAAGAAALVAGVLSKLECHLFIQQSLTEPYDEGYMPTVLALEMEDK